MADTLTPKQRSALMSRIGPRHTKPEISVRKMLHARGWRYRLHQKGLPGTPDIVFPKRRAVLFVNGCFWHGHSCKLGRLPKTRPEFWSAKIEANRARDARKISQLNSAGWRVMTVWQCSLSDRDTVLRDIEEFLRNENHVAETRKMEG